MIQSQCNRENNVLESTHDSTVPLSKTKNCLLVGEDALAEVQSKILVTLGGMCIPLSASSKSLAFTSFFL